MIEGIRNIDSFCGALAVGNAGLFNDVATGSSPKAVQPPQRNKGALVFDGDSLDYYNADGELERSWPAVSGNPDSTFSDQWKSNYGPLPEGSYTISPSQTNRDAFYKAGWGNNDAWGDVRTPLNANSGTYTFGRGGFYVHGGAFPGSAGCIDLVKFNNDFHNWFTRQGGPVNVYVSYPRSITVPGH